MPSVDTVIERWLDTLEGRRDRRGNPLRNLSGCNVFGDRDTLYSYGSHFPLAEYHRRAHGRRRPLFLLNGDRSTVTTSRHQRDTRSALERRADTFGADVLIVPYSALEGAGIDRSTVAPLEIRPDRWETQSVRPCPVDLDDVRTATETVTVDRTQYG